MTNLVITHKKQLLFAVTICLFAILAINSGKIFVNLLDTKSKIDKEKQIWVKISQNIKSELTLFQQKEWSNFAKNNPEIFLQANTSKYLNANNPQSNPATANIITDPFKNILANIAAITRKQIKELPSNK
jgi:hypothetical protein